MPTSARSIQGPCCSLSDSAGSRPQGQASHGACTAGRPISYVARSINMRKTKPSPKEWSRLKSIHTGHRNIARDVARRERGSRTFVANASMRNGESCSGVLPVTMRPMPTSMPQRMCIARSIGSGIGSHEKRRLRRPQQAAEVMHTPSPATGRGGEACQRGTPAKFGRPGPYANEHTCQSGGAIAGPRGDVPTRLTLRATPGEITCRKAEGTLTRWTEPGRRERNCREFSTILGNC